MLNEPKRCFVIMPFSQTSKEHTEDYWTNHYQKFLKPLISSCAGIEPFRSVALRQDIVRQIVNDLVFSPIVVADLTDSNPNVYWELGVRLSFRHGTITIAEEGSEIPFDINTKGVLFYSSETKQRDIFLESLKEALADCLTNPDRPDSVVLETITGRTSVYSVIHNQEIIQKIDGLISEIKQNRSILDIIYDYIQKNEARRFSSIRPTWTFALTKMATSALNLLLAERYIPNESEVYSKAFTFLHIIDAINENISQWSQNKGSGNWFVEKKILIDKWFNLFYNEIVSVKELQLSKC